MDNLNLIAQYVLSGLVIGVIYALMAVGITFIYSIMKMINWSMGEFFMIGSYLQFFLIMGLLGPGRWYLAIPLSMLAVGVLGVFLQRLLLRPMFVGTLERRDEYATIVTISLSVFFRNLAVVVFGPYQFSPPDYFRPVQLGPLPLNGSRFVAFIGSALLLALFYLGVKRTWLGRALQGAAQNRLGVQTAGIDLQRLDQIAFGIGVALAAATGALLAPILLVHPENGAIATVKGFEIIVIGGLGSITGSIIAGLLLGLVESLGTIVLSPAYRDVYGFALLIAILVLRPWGLFGERERVA
ncbi:MAG: branched-chain amino acid ABC transporter permease [Armatimonadota bacterium]|nr:branched-chain amino acid ABC transporter permease [Armatimonadota bacterium]MDR5703239.1 branched-chain amino acid ABC transporter permease [Armatimonadota bacterium]MDR7433825.1 branched-chain amino acid ABC transporter permease [Armatimonadota bacterium]